MPNRPAEAKRLDFISGQVQALMSFALALASVYQEQAMLREHFELSAQIHLAAIETSLAGEKTIDGFLDATKRLRSILRE